MIGIGVICPSEIAYRRFLPALKKAEGFSYIGVGVCRKEELFGAEQLSPADLARVLEQERRKAAAFAEQYGGAVYDGYAALIDAPEVDAVYLPLPPALHFHWANYALARGKHVFVEKPATLSAADTEALIALAGAKGLALHENYMFLYHDQIPALDRILASGEIGAIRLYSVRFGFPKRAEGDFRYSAALGGGALLDAGGYTIQYASHLLGDSMQIVSACLNREGHEVDLYGSAMAVNASGAVAQLSFGMDNAYKCELEVWGSKGTLRSGRVLTAPAGFVPSVTIETDRTETRPLPADDAFLKSILRFRNCITDTRTRTAEYGNILRQAEAVDEIRNLAKVEVQ